MVTELIYFPDNEYQKEFEADVIKAEGNYIVLDKTLFYKEGGGQPSDKGRIRFEGSEYSVKKVEKKNGEIRHILNSEFPEENVQIRGELNWERRYRHMRMHTAQHIISRVVLNEFEASTAGNQIHFEKSRIDFNPVNFSNKDVETIQKQVNEIINKDISITKSEISREILEERVEKDRSNLDLIPSHVDPLRVVEIGEWDICPCGGTHVQKTGEVKGIEIIDRISKGKDTERIVFKLK